MAEVGPSRDQRTRSSTNEHLFTPRFCQVAWATNKRQRRYDAPLSDLARNPANPERAQCSEGPGRREQTRYCHGHRSTSLKIGHDRASTCEGPRSAAMHCRWVVSLRHGGEVTGKQIFALLLHLARTIFSATPPFVKAPDHLRPGSLKWSRISSLLRLRGYHLVAGRRSGGSESASALLLVLCCPKASDPTVVDDRRAR